MRPTSPPPVVPAEPVDEVDDSLDTDDDDDRDEIYLPSTGIASSTIGFGVMSLLTGLGLYVADKKRKK